MARFRKKPVEIEAFKLTYKMAKGEEPAPKWFVEAIEKKEIEVGYTSKIENSQYALIKTLEGTMEARPNDWIIQGVHGEIYPCKPDIFVETYDPVPLNEL